MLELIAKIVVLAGIFGLCAVVSFGAGVVPLLGHGFEDASEMLLWLALFATMLGGWTWFLSGFRLWPAVMAVVAMAVAFLLGRICAELAVYAENQKSRETADDSDEQAR